MSESEINSNPTTAGDTASHFGALHPDDAIAALASAPGPAARGIVRLSGKQSLPLAATLLTDTTILRAPPRRASRYDVHLTLPGLPCPVPADLFVWPTARSYTGEPLVEFHLIGSPPLLELLLTTLFARGARPAQPGEFTLRAFLAGRIDLVQAEAVLGVIDAGNEAELRTALEQLAGGVSSTVARFRGELLDLLADLEAGLDFADEAIEFVPAAALQARLAAVLGELQKLLEQAPGRMISGTRPRIVLAGPPNAGKSTLFNALAGREAALVSDVRGTTRDYLRAEVSLGDLRVELIDTAGWEEAPQGVMEQAQAFRAEQWQRGDLVLWCRSIDDPEAPPAGDGHLPETALLVTTKADLAQPQSPQEGCAVSAHTGTGLPQLIQAIADHLGVSRFGERQLIGSTAARAHDSLASAANALEQALNLAKSGGEPELLSIEIRDALDELGQIVGAVYTDDILGRIFSRFCIGK